MKGLDVELAKVRKTQRREVLLEIKKGSADALRSAVNTQLKTERASKTMRKAVLHLSGLDSLISMEEIMDPLKETYGEVTQRCRVTSMRPAYGESQNATRLRKTSNRHFIIPHSPAAKLHEVKLRVTTVFRIILYDKSLPVIQETLNS
nr:unnamed protein product [Callosobruchus analis]